MGRSHVTEAFPDRASHTLVLSDEPDTLKCRHANERLTRETAPESSAQAAEQPAHSCDVLSLYGHVSLSHTPLVADSSYAMLSAAHRRAQVFARSGDHARRLLQIFLWRTPY